jgi:uncharacterized radical SAM superfamily protein
MICEICEREAKLHPHHLIPRKYLRKGILKKLKYEEIHDVEIDICSDCEKTIHALFKLKELKESYNTLEKLKSEERMRKYIYWVKNKPVGVVIHIKRAWKGGKYE